MALEGTLRDFSLADIFQLIGIQRKTGILTLKSEGDVVTVSFVDGSVVAADSYRKRLDDQIGNVLVKAGHITEAQLQEALKIQKNTLQRVGRVLVDNKFIRPEELRQALQLQVTQIIYRLFRWKDGEYHFSQEEKVDYDRENFVPISAENILMEGVRMVDEWPIIEKKIRSLDMVFRKVEIDMEVEVDEAASLIEEDMDFHLGEQDKGGKPSGGADSATIIRLSREEGRVYELVDGRLKVSEIAERSRLGEFEACKVLYELLNRNLIAEAAPAAAQAAARKAAPARSSLSAAAGVVLALWAGAMAYRQATSPRPLWPLRAGETESTWSQIRGCISRSQLERLAFAIRVYYLAFGATPPSVETLLDQGLARRSDLVDPWERPFVFRPLEGGFMIAGRDAAGEVGPDLTLTHALPAVGVVSPREPLDPEALAREAETIVLPQRPDPGNETP